MLSKSHIKLFLYILRELGLPHTHEDKLNGAIISMIPDIGRTIDTTLLGENPEHITKYDKHLGQHVTGSSNTGCDLGYSGYLAGLIHAIGDIITIYYNNSSNIQVFNQKFDVYQPIYNIFLEIANLKNVEPDNSQDSYMLRAAGELYVVKNDSEVNKLYKEAVNQAPDRIIELDLFPTIDFKTTKKYVNNWFKYLGDYRTEENLKRKLKKLFDLRNLQYDKSVRQEIDRLKLSINWEQDFYSKVLQILSIYESLNHSRSR